MKCASCGTEVAEEPGALFFVVPAFCEGCKPVVQAADHAATLTTTRKKKVKRIEVAVTCSCGARATLHVYGCETPSQCKSATHVLAGTCDPVKGETCPAVVSAIRNLDPGLSREGAEWIAGNGPKGAAP